MSIAELLKKAEDYIPFGKCKHVIPFELPYRGDWCVGLCIHEDTEGDVGLLILYNYRYDLLITDWRSLGFFVWEHLSDEEKEAKVKQLTTFYEGYCSGILKNFSKIYERGMQTAKKAIVKHFEQEVDELVPTRCFL